MSTLSLGTIQISPFCYRLLIRFPDRIKSRDNFATFYFVACEKSVRFADKCFHHDKKGRKTWNWHFLCLHTRTRLLQLADGTGLNPSLQARKFGGKELDLTNGYVNYDFGARGYNPLLGVWDRMDQMCEKYYDTNPYAYCINNPINFIDPFGKEPVYNRYGQYLGTTSEGFQGDILIYSGNDEINFGDMTREEVFKNYSNDIETLDMELSYAAGGIERKYLSNIWTHIASHFEGLQVYDEKFTLSSFEDKRIKFQSDNINTCWYTITPYDSSSLPSIYGTSNNIYNYESTVENIASSIIVHEWYSHVIKHVSSRIKSHRLAYKNVINFKYLWNKTTDSYKRYNLDYLRYYTNKETGRKNVDSIYQNLYKRYVGK